MSDSTSLLDILSASQAQKEVAANNLFNASSPAALFGRRGPSTAALTWGYYGGRMIVGGVATAIPNGTVSLAANATNYFEVDAAGVPSVNSVGFTVGRTPLYSIVTGASGVVSYQDFRSFLYIAPDSASEVSGPVSSTNNALARFSGTDGGTLESSGVLVTDANAISGYRGDLNAQTGTTYTLTAADTGKVVELTNAAAITLTLPADAAVGFCCTVVQGGAGQVTLTPAGSATRRHRQSHTKTAGKWAGVTLYVRTNAGGTAAEYVMMGDTAA